jgi:putative holliday junction resolvase
VTRLLGIDLGTRRMGLAVAHDEVPWVRPLATINRSTAERERAALARVVAEQDIDEIVVGLPLNMDGSQGEQARLTREWAQAVLGPLGVPVCWRDERLTSERAGQRSRPRRGRSGGPPSAARRADQRATIDRHAAALILEAELSARRDEAQPA